MAKGEGFEREISKDLSLWWSREERDDIFWRSSQSGGRAKSRAIAGLNTAYSYGDISFLDPIGKPLLERVVIEVKRGYTSTSRKIKQKELIEYVEKSIVGKGVDKVCKAILKLFSKTKKGGGVDPLEAVDGKREEPLQEWAKKAEIDRALAGVPWYIIVFRRDYHETCICYPYELHKELCGFMEQTKTEFEKEPYLLFRSRDMKEALIILNFKRWLDTLPPAIFELIPGRIRRLT